MVAPARKPRKRPGLGAITGKRKPPRKPGGPGGISTGRPGKGGNIARPTRPGGRAKPGGGIGTGRPGIGGKIDRLKPAKPGGIKRARPGGAAAGGKVGKVAKPRRRRSAY